MQILSDDNLQVQFQGLQFQKFQEHAGKVVWFGAQGHFSGPGSLRKPMSLLPLGEINGEAGSLGWNGDCDKSARLCDTWGERPTQVTGNEEACNTRGNGNCMLALHSGCRSFPRSWDHNSDTATHEDRNGASEHTDRQWQEPIPPTIAGGYGLNGRRPERCA